MLPELRDSMWYGTQASYDAAVALEKMIAAQIVAGPFDEPAPDYLLQKMGKVGMIRIKGSLMNSDNAFTAFFGVSTYPAIRRAVVSAAKDPSVEQILLVVDSGGGAVNGAADTADLIATVNKKVKPVTTFADGTMASAAYWLGVSAQHRISTKTSEVGSIGILSVHAEESERLKKEGIKVTVQRAGKFKALNNPFEPLSEKGREQTQGILDAAYQVFGQHVADSHGISFADMDRKMGQGRVFFGAQALDAGLVDEISTLDAVLSKLSAGKGVDKKRRVYDNGIKGASMDRAGLTEQEIAALAAGGLEAKPGELTVEAAAAAKVVADAALAVEVAAAKAVTDAAALAATAEAIVESELVKFLRGEISAAQEKLTQGAVDKAALEAKVSTTETTHNALLEIARGSVGTLRVALGSSAGNAASLGALEVVAEHKKLAEDFGKKFKVGGVAVVAASQPEQASSTATASQAARIAATKP